ncbi:MAG: GNAT family N-acetyltransferase [Methanomassiliicoccales archaeon]|jgi:ribosomal-protein-alanine N-acetyltransferase
MLRLRPLLRGDVPDLVIMSRENMAAIVKESWGIEWTDEPLLEWLCDGATTTMVLEEDGDPIGYYSLEVLDSYHFITSIQIRRDKQGRGLGRTMMREIEATVLDEGTDGVELYVQDSNEKAIEFYTSLGYRTICRSGNNFLLRKSATEIVEEQGNQKD